MITVGEARESNHTTVSATPLAFTLTSGDRLGDYEIVRPSRIGGTCEIYHVYNKRFRLRAIARIARRDVLEAHPWIAVRMLTNAEIISDARQVNLMRIIDFGLSGEADARPYVIGERLVGRTLDECIRKHGRLDTDQLIDLGLQVIRGLLGLQRVGLNHGDVKPSNIMISPDQDGRLRATLIDFDLASPLDGSRAPGLCPGTPSYLPPEQSLGVPHSTHFDIYALGVTLHEAALGECPLDEAACLAAIRDEGEWPTICPLHLEHPELGIPRALSKLIARLCHRDRPRRPKSLREVEAALERLQTPKRRPQRSALIDRQKAVRAHVAAAIEARPLEVPPPPPSQRPTAFVPTIPKAEAITSLTAIHSGTDAAHALTTHEDANASSGAIGADPRHDTTSESSWHAGARFEASLITERASSPLRELRRGALAQVVIGSLITALILAGAARVFAVINDAHAEAARTPVVTPEGETNEKNRADEATLPEALGPLPRAQAQDAGPTESSPTETREKAESRPSPSDDDAIDTTERRHREASTSAPPRRQNARPTARPQETLAKTAGREGRDSHAEPRPTQLTDLPQPPATGRQGDTDAGDRPNALHGDKLAPKLDEMTLAEAKKTLRRLTIRHRFALASADACFFKEGQVVGQSVAPGEAIAGDAVLVVDYCVGDRDLEEGRERNEEEK